MRSGRTQPSRLGRHRLPAVFCRSCDPSDLGTRNVGTLQSLHQLLREDCRICKVLSSRRCGTDTVTDVGCECFRRDHIYEWHTRSIFNIRTIFERYSIFKRYHHASHIHICGAIEKRVFFKIYYHSTSEMQKFRKNPYTIYFHVWVLGFAGS